MIRDLVDAGVSETAPEFAIDSADYFGVCDRAFARSSAARVLDNLHGVAAFACENMQINTNGASASLAIKIGEVFLAQLGTDSQVTFTDFTDLAGLCAWIVNAERDDIGESVAQSEMPDTMAGEVGGQSIFATIFSADFRTSIG